MVQNDWGNTMNIKTAFRLSLGLALAGGLLWAALSIGLPAQATFDRQDSDLPNAPATEPNWPADIFAPAPAADALPPVSRIAAASQQLPPVAAPWMLPNPVWRIGITRDGLYKLSYDALGAVGVPVSGTATGAFRLWHRGTEVAIEVRDANNNGIFEPGDALVFYGEKFHGSVQDEKYTDENVYWLSVSPGAQGKRMTTRSVPPTGAPATGICLETVVAEQNLRYFPRWNNTPGTDTTWFWERMIAPLGQIITHTFPIPLTNIHTAAHTATLRVEVAGRSYSAAINPDHHLNLTLNGTFVGEVFWDGQTGHVADFDIPSALLQEGNNTLSVGVVGTVVAQDVYFDRAEVTYRRKPVAQQNTLSCTVPETGTHTYTFTDLPSTARIYDITDPLNPIRLTGHVAFTFRDTITAGARYIAGIPFGLSPTYEVYLPLLLKNSGGAVQSLSNLTPEITLANTELPALTLTQYQPNATLITPTAGADLLIIAPREFHTALQPLIVRRQAQGLRVALVAEQDIYPLFNGGVYHPEAIRAFVAHAYTNWPGAAPRYLLLVGGGHFNFKGYAQDAFGVPARIWIPPYLEFADPDQGEVPVDTRYGDVNGDGMPELMVGRIPANSETELLAYLQKLLAYDNLPTAPWMETVLLVADDGATYREYFDHALNRIRNNTFSPWAVTEQVYIQDYCPKDSEDPPAIWTAPCPAATRALTETWSQGASLLLYAGHGAPGVWANEPLLRGSQLATLQPMTGQPFVIALDCWDGFWMYPRDASLGAGREAISIGERATMGWTDRGAIALFGPAGLAYLHFEEQLTQAMMTQLFAHGERRIGELTQVGRLAIWGTSGRYLARTYTLLGDPSMQLRIEDITQALR